MPNAFLPRAIVHDWSETIGATPADHQAAISRLLRDQRRLSRFVEENRESMTRASGGAAMYLVGVITRMFELAGGRLRGATWEQIRAVEARVGAKVPELLPVDAGFPERLRKIPGRAQPHIIDEALLALFEREIDPNEPDLAAAEKAKVAFLLWVAVEVLDENWSPKKDFAGETSYTYVKIDLKK